MLDFEIQDGALVWYKGEEETVIIPEAVSRIGVGAFRDSGVVRVVLHNGITRIHRGAFMCCYRLQGMEIPDSVTRIDRDAFYRCTALESVRLPAGLMRSRLSHSRSVIGSSPVSRAGNRPKRAGIPRRALSPPGCRETASVRGSGRR